MAQAMLSFFEQNDDEENIADQMEDCSSLKQIDNVPIVEINQSFPRQPTDERMTKQIEYRIKVLSSHSEIFNSGQSKKIETNIRITRKPGRLSILLKPAENFELRLNNEGFISPMLRGKIPVELMNSNIDVQHLPAGSIVGYLILTPFIR